MPSVLIKNGLIVNGAGGPPEKKDLLIRRGKIVEIGDLKQVRADETIDAVNAFVAPGFIDVQSEIDHSLTIFSDPRQEQLLRQGITTVVGGNGGWSLAPIVNKFSLDFLAPGRHRPDSRGVNFHWQSTNEFLKQLAKREIGVNFATLTGYSNVRRAFSRLFRRDLTDKGTEAALAALTTGIKEGAIGCSIKIDHLAAKKISRLEMTELIKVLARTRGILTLRLNDWLENSLVELQTIINLAKEHKVSIEISRLQFLSSQTTKNKKIREIVEAAADHQPINFDCVLGEPAVVEPRFFLPSSLQKSDRVELLRALNEKEWLEKIAKNFRNFDSAKISIRRMPTPLHFLSGQSLEQFAANQDLAIAPAWIKLFQLTRGDISFFYNDIDEEQAAAAALSPYSLIAAGEQGRSLPEFFRLAVAANWPIEKIVAKLTGQPARHYRLANRGFIKKDFWADLVVLRENKSIAVLVNGQSSGLNGQVIRGGQK